MKKFRLLILFFAASLLFTSCITKDDIKELKDELKDSEDYFEEKEDEYAALEDEVSSLELELSNLTESNVQLSSEIASIGAENSDLESQIPQPPFQFSISTFTVHMKFVFEDAYVGGKMLDALYDREFDRELLDNGFLEYTYELEGDVDSDEYISLKIITGYDYLEVYDIVASYSGEKYGDDYDDLVHIMISALITITENYYCYDSEYWDRAEEILDDGTYFHGYMAVTQEKDGDIVTTRLFCKN